MIEEHGLAAPNNQVKPLTRPESWLMQVSRHDELSFGLIFLSSCSRVSAPGMPLPSPWREPVGWMRCRSDTVIMFQTAITRAADDERGYPEQ